MVKDMASDTGLKAASDDLGLRKRTRGSAATESSPTDDASLLSSKRPKYHARVQEIETEIDTDLDSQFNVNSDLFDAAASRNTNSTAYPVPNDMKQDDEKQSAEKMGEHSMLSLSSETDHLEASCKVWYTTELLEQIISYLPAVDVVVASGIDKRAHNCANSSPLSPLTQLTRFLHPGSHELDIWWYCEARLMPGRNVENQKPSFEVIPTGFGRPGTHKTPYMKSVYPVTLCPLLQLNDCHEENAIDRIMRQAWTNEDDYDKWNDECVDMIACPTEDSIYAGMQLTHPSVPRIRAELTFTHDLDPMRMIQAKRVVVEQASPITFRQMVASVRRQPGDLFVHEPPSPSNNWKACHYVKHDSSISEEVAQQVQEHGGSFKIDPKKSRLELEVVVVPCEQEWLEMDHKKAEAKKKYAKYLR